MRKVTVKATEAAEIPEEEWDNPPAGTVDSNHENLYITLLALVLRVLRSTHAEVNGMEEEKGENRDGNGDVNGKGRLAGAEQGREQRNDGADERRRSIRGPTEGRLESKSERGKTKRVNLDVDVETR